MIPTTPLPAWRDLAGAFSGPAPDDADLGGPWADGRGAAVWFSRSAWALAALALWWEGRFGRPPRVWLPDYFCNQSTAPLRARGLVPAFYPVTADLGPDWDSCERLAAGEAPDLFVLVHYFGHPADGARARRFCRGHGALLIEDAAHALVPAGGIGDHGDFTVYSPWKLLAVPAGAVLVVRDAALAGPLAEARDRLGGAAPEVWPWLLKRMVQISPLGPVAAALRRGPAPDFRADPPMVAMAATPCLPTAARCLLAQALPALGSVARARIRNAAFLAARFGAAGFRPLVPPTETGPAPYRFVLACADEAQARALFDDLCRQGCPAESWPDLAPEVRGAPDDHAAALDLRKRLVCLPVHQSVRFRDLEAHCRPEVCLQPPSKALDTGERQGLTGPR